MCATKMILLWLVCAGNNSSCLFLYQRPIMIVQKDKSSVYGFFLQQLGPFFTFIITD